jgi:hypothetical protein
VIYLKLSRKFGIVAMVLLAVFLPLAVLGGSEGDDASDETCEKPPWGFRWMRGFGRWNGEKTVDEAVEDMAEKLGLTEEEVADVTPIAQEIADLREQLKAKMEELKEVIGPKVEAYRESKVSEMPRGFRGMKGMWGRNRCPCQEILEETSPEESE